MLQVKAKFRDEPWDHLYLETVFTPKAFLEMLERKPKIHQCQPLEGYPDRMIWPLAKEIGFWAAIRDEITRPHFMKTIAKKLGVTRNFWPRAAICRDLPGYMTQPHLDASFKVMTLIVYLPSGGAQKMLGTRLLKKEDDEFTFAKQLGFFPNVGLAFKAHDKAWHEVPIVGPADGIRDTLHICCFDTPEREFK